MSLEKDINPKDMPSTSSYTIRSIESLPICTSKELSTSGSIKVNKKVIRNQESDDHDSDYDDFVSPRALPKKTFTPKDLHLLSESLVVSYRNRSYYLSEIYNILNDNQKDAVKDIGFGFVGDFVVRGFSRNICSWVLQNYDETKNVLHVGGFDINVTRKAVHDMYGLPMGHISMNLPLKSQSANEVIRDWKAQFPADVERIRYKHLKKILESSKESGKTFVINFLVAYVTIMIDSPSMGTCNQLFLENIGDSVAIKDLDWCGFVIDCLNNSKKRLMGKLMKNKTTTYIGPVSFLVVIMILFLFINDLFSLNTY